MARAQGLLAGRHTLSLEAAVSELGVDRAAASAALARLCRRGVAVYDIERRELRHRPLFEEAIDEGRFFPPDPREEQARCWVAGGQVAIAAAVPRETRKRRRLPHPDGGRVEREVVYRDFHLSGRVADQPTVEVILSDEERPIFGTCGCRFLRENLLNLGPCEHMVALIEAARGA